MAFSAKKDRKARKRKAKEKTRQFKRRRRNLKENRGSDIRSKEVREGTSYETGVDMTTVDIDIERIPEPSIFPNIQLLPASGDYNLVFVDLETTGMGKLIIT